MSIEWLKSLFTKEYTYEKPENHGTTESSLEHLQQELNQRTVEKKQIDNSWYYIDTLNSTLNSESTQKSKIEADAKKNVSLYYQDTLTTGALTTGGSQGSIDRIQAIDPTSKTASSSYYQDSIAPAPSVQATEEIDKIDILGEEEKDVQKFTSLMTQFMEEVQEAEKAGELDFTQLMGEIFKIQIQAQEDASILTRERLLKTKSDRKKVNETRLQKMEEMLKSAQETQTWSRFQAAATTLQLAAAAIGVSGTLGVAALVFAIGNAVDQMFDEPVKKGLASLISGGNKASKEWWTSAFQYGAAGISLVGSLATMGVKAGSDMAELAKVPMKWFGATTSGMKAATTGMSGWTKYRHDNNKAEMYELTNKITGHDEKIKSALKEISELINKQYLLMRTWSQNKKAEADAISMLFRN